MCPSELKPKQVVSFWSPFLNKHKRMAVVRKSWKVSKMEWLLFWPPSNYQPKLLRKTSFASVIFKESIKERTGPVRVCRGVLVLGGLDPFGRIRGDVLVSLWESEVPCAQIRP